ncbi:E3 ubiquitin-protein ligase MARCHF5 isoform X3 [Halyomorpha halys]|uniref:E3 ubiquitin-protein ligase MARCHF5 isoform X3 n=1 Tax=Halyomorpha halys TaxID=286706 RepID=UPI0006D52112|nr:E3 ubiquitin-protein ligase MARCH5 isoform X3 [Halyomorpha halys]
MTDDSQQAQRNLVDNGNNVKQCWICFATEDDDSAAQWIQPCNCKGTTKWVHQGCLQQWVDEKQKSGRDVKVACPQCKTEYIIFFPNTHTDKLVMFLDKVDAFVYKSCPFFAAGIMVGSLYWTAVTYGAITVMQAHAVEVMERFEPAVLLTGLPCIPVFLITFKMVQWEDSLLEFLRKAGPRLPVLRHFLPAPVTNESGTNSEAVITEEMSCTRVFTGALLLPTIATITGDILYKNTVRSAVQRTFLGGLTFIIVRGIIKMYHKQQVYKRIRRRRILDYSPQSEDQVYERRIEHIIL